MGELSGRAGMESDGEESTGRVCCRSGGGSVEGGGRRRSGEIRARLWLTGRPRCVVHLADILTTYCVPSNEYDLAIAPAFKILSPGKENR